MTAPRLLVFGAIAFIASVSASYAGPCMDDIDKMQARIDAKLEAKAAAGPTGRQVGASTHVQPTPRSIAAAEEKLGEVSAETVAAVRQAMLRARAADSAGDKNACEQALADVATCDRSLDAALNGVQVAMSDWHKADMPSCTARVRFSHRKMSANDPKRTSHGDTALQRDVIVLLTHAQAGP